MTQDERIAHARESVSKLAAVMRDASKDANHDALADAMGVRPDVLACILRGGIDPTIAQLLAFCVVVNVEPAELLARAGSLLATPRRRPKPRGL